MIKLYCRLGKHAETTAVLRCAEELKNRGIHLVDTANKADVVLLHSQVMPEFPDHPRILIFQRLDSCQLSTGVRLRIEQPEVKFVLHYSKFKDLQDYNRYSDARHRQWVKEKVGGRIQGPYKEKLSDAALAKVRLFCNQLHWGGRLDFHSEPFHINQDRPIDVIWIGKIKERGIIDHHRRWCVDAMTKIPSAVVATGDRKRYPIYTGMYRQWLRRSKIAVCTWGFGEGTERDFVGPLNGCTIIRPRTDYCTEVDLPSHITCEPDFSDLAEKVELALSQWPNTEARVELREHLLQLRSPAILADRLAALIMDALK